MLNFSIIAIALCVASFLALSPRLRQSSSWRATVTPLASIMGSGFLISAPLLASIVGNKALICMTLLLVLAYAVGSAIRFNIRYFEPIEHNKGTAQSIALLSRIVLSIAYFISVTYYLQLLAAFILNLFGSSDEFMANVITTLLLLVIGAIAIWRGLSKLEKIETYAVSLNLGMIAGLLLALVVYNLQLAMQGDWHLANIPAPIDSDDIRVLLGLLIVVQGFETSRYLGAEHPAEQRIKTMRIAQLTSATIYILFIGLATVLFHTGLDADVTAVTALMLPVAIVLPIMISIAAMGSQFSAAVADTSGAGGLVDNIIRHKLPMPYVYASIIFATLFLTWETNVNEIITYASRAFALFYFLQCLVAFLVAYKQASSKARTGRLVLFFVIALICLIVFLFGIPSEA